MSCAVNALTKVTSNPHPHSHHNGDSHSNGHDHAPDEFNKLHTFLQAHFGDVSEPKRDAAEGEEDELLTMEVNVDGSKAVLDLISMVSSFHAALTISGWTPSQTT